MSGPTFKAFLWWETTNTVRPKKSQSLHSVKVDPAKDGSKSSPMIFRRWSLWHLIWREEWGRAGSHQILLLHTWFGPRALRSFNNDKFLFLPSLNLRSIRHLIFCEEWSGCADCNCQMSRFNLRWLQNIVGSEDVGLCDIYESGGWLAGVSIRWLRRPTARPCTCHPTPDTAPHSNWPLFPVPLPSLHAHQDDDIATTSSLFNSTN